MALNRAEILLAATDKTKAAFASVGRNLDGLKTSATAMQGRFVALGGAVAGALAVTQAKAGIDLLDRLDDLAEKSGITVEKLSELRFAGEAVGTPLDALAGGVLRLSKQMAEAASGSKEAADTFKTLGIEVKNADGSLRSSDAVLGDLADRFASYEDGAGKAALAQRIFGKSGADMIPLLNQGSKGIERLKNEAIALGAIYGGDLAKDAASFNDNLTKLRIASEAAAVSLAGPLLSSLVRVTNELLEGRKAFGSYWEAFKSIGLGTSPFDSWSDGAKKAEVDVKRLAGEIERLQAGRRPTAENAGGAAFVGPSGSGRSSSRLAAAQAELSEAQKRKTYYDSLIRNAVTPEAERLEKMFSGGNRLPPMGGGGGGRGGGGGTKDAKDAEAAAKRYLETLDRQLEKTERLSQVEISLAEIRRIQAEGGVVTEAMKQQILLKAEDIDATKKQTEAEKKREDAQEEARKRFFDLQEEGRRVFEETRVPLESYNAELERLNALYKAGVINADTLGRAVQRSTDAFDEAQKRAKDVANEQDDFGRRAAENIQDSIGSSLVNLMEGNYKSIGDGFGKLLTRMAAEAVAADLSRKLFGGLVKGGEGEGLLGGFLGQLGGMLGSGKKKGKETDSLSALLASNDAFGTGAGASAAAFSSALMASSATTTAALGSLATAASAAATSLGASGGTGAGGLLGGLFGGGGGGGSGYSPADQAGLDKLISGLASFDVGTDYVPEDMIAKIHKGERIVPAAQNKPGYGSNVQVSNVFHLSGPVDRRTQSQVAAAAYAGSAMAFKRDR